MGTFKNLHFYINMTNYLSSTDDNVFKPLKYVGNNVN